MPRFRENECKNEQNSFKPARYLGVKSFWPLEHYKTCMLLYMWYFSKIQLLLSSAIPARVHAIFSLEELELGVKNVPPRFLTHFSSMGIVVLSKLKVLYIMAHCSWLPWLWKRGGRRRPSERTPAGSSFPRNPPRKQCAFFC